MSQQAAPGAPRTDLLHGVIHGVQVFGIAFVAALGVKPHAVTRDVIVAAVLAGIRALFATVHH